VDGFAGKICKADGDIHAFAAVEAKQCIGPAGLGETVNAESPASFLMPTLEVVCSTLRNHRACNSR
jgi:hypothetical protein